MQVTITIPDSQAGIVPHMSDFANKVVLEALEREQIKKTKQSKSQPSKWAKLVEKIESMNIPSEVGEHIRQCSKEFREDFAFKQDLIDET